jgi:hypothetical protein
MGREFGQPLVTFRWRNISYLNVVGNLIDGNLQGCTIHTLEDVLMHILNRHDSSINLNIDMRTVLLKEIWVIWHDPTVVPHSLLTRAAFFWHCKGPSVIPIAILWKSILRNGRVVCKLPWVLPFALYITSRALGLHATSLQIVLTTRTMSHYRGNNIYKFSSRVPSRIRELSRDDLIDGFRCSKLVIS